MGMTTNDDRDAELRAEARPGGRARGDDGLAVVGAADEFDRFARDAGDRLWRSLVPAFGPTIATEAAADALVYGWEHWARVGGLDNPVGYLYRVAHRAAVRRRSSTGATRREAESFLAAFPNAGSLTTVLPEVEPGLLPALAALTEMQRTVVWLIEGCGWGLTETGDHLGVSISTFRNHLARGIANLRAAMKVPTDA